MIAQDTCWLERLMLTAPCLEPEQIFLPDSISWLNLKDKYPEAIQ